MRIKIIIAVVALAVLVAVYFLFFHKKAPLKSTAKIGSQTVKTSGSSNSSITGLFQSGIKALTSSPTNKGSSQAASDDDSSDDDSSDDSSDDE